MAQGRSRWGWNWRTSGVCCGSQRAEWRLDVPNPVPDARDGLRLLGLVGKSRSGDRAATEDELAAIRAAWSGTVPPEIVDIAVDSCVSASTIPSCLTAAEHAIDRVCSGEWTPKWTAIWASRRMALRAGSR